MRISSLCLSTVGSVLACGLLSACGGASSKTASGGAISGSANAGSSGVASSSGETSASPLSAEARSKATGDIPDSQVFLSFHNPSAGYSMRYPEGWAQRGSGADVTFQDKNNIVHILVSRGPAPTGAAVVATLARERRSLPSLTYGAPSSATIQGAPVVKVSYSTLSPPNPVTGKRVQLLVDRYVYAHAGKLATVDLGTAKGVDNIDAYKMMSRSFRWR
jgi:hypothetical protein